MLSNELPISLSHPLRSSYGADKLLARTLSARTLLQDEQRVRFLLKHIEEVSCAQFFMSFHFVGGEARRKM